MIIAWVNSFVNGQNHFSMGKFALAWENSFLALAIRFEHGEISFVIGKFICSWAHFICINNSVYFHAQNNDHVHNNFHGQINQATLLHAQTVFSSMGNKVVFMHKISSHVGHTPKGLRTKQHTQAAVLA